MIKTHAAALLVSVGVLGLLFLLVDPRSLPSVALFAIFALIYLVVAQVVILLLLGTKFLLGLKWRTSTIRRVGFSAALLPIFLLLLQSVGQLTVRDSLLAFALTVLLYVYSHRMFGNVKGTDA